MQSQSGELVRRDRDTDASGDYDEGLYPLPGPNGYVNALTDGAGDVPERYGYDAFGRRQPYADDYTEQAMSGYGWATGANGTPEDRDTGMSYRGGPGGGGGEPYHSGMGRYPGPISTPPGGGGGGYRGGTRYHGIDDGNPWPPGYESYHKPVYLAQMQAILDQMSAAEVAAWRAANQRPDDWTRPNYGGPLQYMVDFTAGAASDLSWGASDYVIQQAGYDHLINRDSWAYTAGGYAGMAAQPTRALYHAGHELAGRGIRRLSHRYADNVVASGARGRNYPDVQSVSQRAQNVGPKPRRYQGSKPKYHDPGTHNPRSTNYNKRKSDLPDDAEETYMNAVPDDPDHARHWYGKNAEGRIYRYHNSNDGTAHWSGEIEDYPNPYVRERLR